MKNQKIRKRIIIGVCGAVLVMMTFGVICICHYSVKQREAEHAQIMRAEHQPTRPLVMHKTK